MCMLTNVTLPLRNIIYYDNLIKSRFMGRGGKVGLLIDKVIFHSYQIKHIIANDNVMEILFVHILHNLEEIIVGVMCIPPMDVDELLKRLDEIKKPCYLLKSISQCPSDVLQHLPIDNPTSSRSLCVMAHNFLFPPKDNRNFLSRVLYNAICLLWMMPRGR